MIRAGSGIRRTPAIWPSTAPTAWLTRSLDLDVQTLVEYCNAKERGVYSLALLLGRSRASAAQELKTPPLGLGDWSLTLLDEGYPGYEAKIEKTDQPNQVVLILTAPKSEDNEPLQIEPAAAGDERNEFRSTGASGARLTIDTARHVLLKVENFDHGKLTSSSTYSDFVELGGSWWARRMTSFDDKARKTAETTLDVQLLAREVRTADGRRAGRQERSAIHPSARPAAQGCAAARGRRLGQLRRPGDDNALRLRPPAVGRVAEASYGRREARRRQAGRALAADCDSGHDSPQ